MFYWMMKWVFLGPFLRIMFRIRTSGRENIPLEGPAILAANHQSPLDTVLMPLMVRRRQVVFLGKSEYFENPRVAWFFKGTGVIPIRRGGPESHEALEGAVVALGQGKLLGIFPEGTRSPDGRLYRGKTGVARIALRAQVPVIPIAVMGTHELMPYQARFPKPGTVTIRYGKPLSFAEEAGKPMDHDLLRVVTDRIMAEIGKLSGQPYADAYAADVKAQLRRAEPPGGRMEAERIAPTVRLPEPFFPGEPGSAP